MGSSWQYVVSALSSVTYLVLLGLLTWVAVAHYRRTGALSSGCLGLASGTYLASHILIRGAVRLPGLASRLGFSVYFPTDLYTGMSYAVAWVMLACYILGLVGVIGLIVRLRRRPVAAP
jgi:hypothetical protein